MIGVVCKAWGQTCSSRLHKSVHSCYGWVCVCVCVFSACMLSCMCMWLYVWAELIGAIACVCAVCYISLSKELSLVRLSRLIYGPAGGACHDFLNLKSPPPNKLFHAGCQLGLTAPPAVMWRHVHRHSVFRTFPVCVFPECLGCLSCLHVSTIVCIFFVSM